MKLILASTSPYRASQLERLGLAFEQQDPQVDEEILKQAGLAPADLAEQLALEKARAIHKRFPEALVIGGDQLVSFEGAILGKPGSNARAVQQLLQLQGKTHELITAIVVLGPAFEETHINHTQLTMRPLDEAALQRYVEFDEPWNCAGAYKLESRGITLFESIRSSDHSAITGIPLMELTSLLRRAGLELP
ncbi:Maf family protein [Gimesia panareensis]|uniref:7-methyl-GTP pyrophosphatase n=1 Tax=Gimesia panareensis TaxID=2527978 RepID=A0A517Q902_9PLAN|nr:nucleoside triphosphate pyrophosphatase [Gimesia panareensis]QDT28097.1 Maf-like protein YceF [Gimesia panareensis]QDU50963.1 Maf-like protein YceF [Gimesia panareensis]